jgi:hypothetical protein
VTSRVASLPTAEPLVDQVAHDLVALEVALPLEGQRPRQRLEDADLVLPLERLGLRPEGDGEGEQGEGDEPDGSAVRHGFLLEGSWRRSWPRPF